MREQRGIIKNKMKKNKIILRAENTIAKYKNDDSIYYRELIKSYKEYKKSHNNDAIRDELYLDHINDLCNFIVERKRASFTILTMLLILTITIGLSGYSTYKYYDLSNNINKNIIKVNNSSSLIINYKNLENFNANILSDTSTYLNLKPLTLNIFNRSRKNQKMHYDIYLIEDNKELKQTEVIPREVFMYNIKTDTRDNGVRYLNKCQVENNKIRIFSGTIETNKEINVELRMWIDKNSSINYTNKKYRFKIFVDGYAI